MSMRWMKLEAQPSVPSLCFLLISRNKVKIVFFCLFPDLSVQYKNIPKIKVLRMPCQFNMIFLVYLRIYRAKITAGGAATWPRGWWARPPSRARPPASWAHGGPPPLIPAPIFFLCLTQTRKTNSSTSSSHFCCDFRSPCSKHLSQNYLGRLFLGVSLLHWSNYFLF